MVITTEDKKLKRKKIQTIILDKFKIIHSFVYQLTTD